MLSKLIQRRGLTCTEVLKRAGVMPKTYYGIINGDSHPRGATLIKLADALELNDDERDELFKFYGY